MVMATHHRIVELPKDKAEEALNVFLKGPYTLGVRRLVRKNLLLPQTLLAFQAVILVSHYMTSSLLVSVAIGCGLLPIAFYFVARYVMHKACYNNFTEAVDGQTFYAYWTGEGRRMWVALDDKGKVIGTIGLGHVTTEVCELFRMSVSSSSRQGGVGSALLAHLLQEAINRGYKVVQLTTLAVFFEAVALYTKHGFQVTQSYMPASFLIVEINAMQKQLSDSSYQHFAQASCRC